MEEQLPSDLVTGVSRGDVEAVEEAMVRLWPGLMRYVTNQAGRMVAGLESPEDLVQSVCREVLEGVGQGRFEFRCDAEFEEYLRQAAIYKIMNRHRYHAAAKRDVRRLKNEATEPVHPDLTPSKAAIRIEAAERLSAVLDAMPPRYGEIIRLAHFEGLPHDQIAQRMNLQPGHSRVLLSRARARLAVLLAAERGFTEWRKSR